MSKLIHYGFQNLQIFKLFFILSMLVFSSVDANTHHKEKGILGDERWLDTYYKNPQPQKATAWFMRKIEEQQRSDYSNYMSGMFVAAQILRQHPELAEEWVDKIAGNQDESIRVFLAYVLWYSKITNAKQLMTDKLALSQDTLDNFQKHQATDALERNYLDSENINMLWAEFQITGNPLAINKIIDYILIPLGDVTIPEMPEINRLRLDQELGILILSFSGAWDPNLAKIITDRFESGDEESKAVLAPMMEMMEMMDKLVKSESGNKPTQ